VSGWVLASVIFTVANIVRGNPTGGKVLQGNANFSSSGSQLTITTSQNAFINWQTFNIAVGETTTFLQPSSSSVVWNQISDVSPSQILGSLNANGYVVLQNPNGFYIGGQAAITAHGLILTTSPLAMPDLSAGGPWDFGTPPPTAKIINYGQINVGGGGSAFLIANDVENNGTINAPGGNIGLYAGQQVLVSSRPDGRGLSANVTLPAGSVDNSGKLIADGGSIAMQAQVVNQGGLVQANTVANHNGVIELLASESVNLGANSQISAHGDSQGSSDGGSVTIRAGNTFSDQVGSAINIAGGAQGGNGGQLEISAPTVNPIQSQISAGAASGYQGGTFTLDPINLNLTSAYVNSLVPILNSGIYQLNLQADNTITVSTLWILANPGAPAQLNLTAGNDIIFNNGSGINAGNNWSVSLFAGPQNLTTRPATPRTDGVYLDGNSFIQTQNGDINISAANEVLVNANTATATGNGIRTIAGGNINVTALTGDVNTGGNTAGFKYLSTAPYITSASTLGGISTAAGGNVTITAGGNVTSYLPTGSGPAGTGDAGSGAFGLNPGNVTIRAIGGSVYGHYVEANGTGTITAGQNAGSMANPFALSLISGSWNVNASGNIYLQEVRNPNGLFNNQIAFGKGTLGSPGNHLFTYSPDSSVNLTAGNGVYLTDQNVPRLATAQIPVLYPPTLNISAGQGGVNLEGDVTLFPSSDGNLIINTSAGGGLIGATGGAGVSGVSELMMSDSSQTRWIHTGDFSDLDHGNTLAELNNPNPVTLNISGDMENITLLTTKETDITVHGNMLNANFSGQNLHAGDQTRITVDGQIFYSSPLTFVPLNTAIPILPAGVLPPGLINNWDSIFQLLVDPQAIANIVIPANTLPSQYLTFAGSAFLFPTFGNRFDTGNPGFTYTPPVFVNGNLQTAGQLGFNGPMAASVLAQLANPSQPLTVLVYQNGVPETRTDASGNIHFVTQTVNWAPAAQIQALYQDSQGAPSPSSPQIGLRLGGPGQFNISAGSISLGNSYGILSEGVWDESGFDRYQNLASLTHSGADLNVTVAGDLSMLTSAIASTGGGNVTVTSTGGSMNLGTEQSPGPLRQIGLGIYTSGDGNVNVTAYNDVNVNGSRIAAFDGGNITVESQHGSVNAGDGAATLVQLGSAYVDPRTGQAGFYQEDVFGSGIIANTLVNPSQVPGGAQTPGNITVLTPNGDINANQGGIIQEALNGNVAAGPTVTLTAGTPASGGSPAVIGNIDLGESGVIGGTVIATATGNITGLIISRQNSTVNAAQSFSGTVLSGGSANVSATSISGASTIIGVGGVSVSGTLGTGAQVLGQNVSVNGGASTSTLGTSANASTSATSASSTAGDQSQQQVANNGGSGGDDKDKKGKGPGLVRRTGRVTVILPEKS
jgi:filamentous hemagglutinin family protein